MTTLNVPNRTFIRVKKYRCQSQRYTSYSLVRERQGRQRSHCHRNLSQEFFAGKECGIDVKVKMIYDGKEGDIINQYVLFTKICNEQMKKHGRTRKAVTEAIQICKDRDVLREYLSSRESEVADIMMVLYDEEEIMRSYVESEVYDAKIETAKRLLKMQKLDNDEVAAGSGLTIEEVEELASELQLA